ncbi:hypothetical protein B0I33_103450 [Prauserella shujinwangii]|uniref:Uncharacterized protein n=1 Tax=Prauserella shujinwangii TaxID=1453103 RepID=A0A2T0LZ76_9PSEU|nr:hypothetical protein [Prauserella shujinwangii]PRX49414.1 hypothetical protein B0I33_103450 [Prauserella shujinwangii]
MLSGAVHIAPDRVVWSARRHRGRGGPTAYAEVPFARLHGARATLLPDAGGDVPWLRLSDNALVYARPGPAVTLGSDSGECMLPVPDAEAVVALLNRRILRWRSGPRD